MQYLQTTTELDRGILNSFYKQEIKRDIKVKERKSISRIKSLVSNHQGKIESQTGVILRVSLFVATLLLISF